MAEVSKLRRAQLPTELLREVVQYYAQTVAWREPENPRHSYKPRWSDFEPLTLTSKVLRQLALEAWFEVYYAQSPGDLLHVWPEVGVWTRELHCVDLGTDLKICPVQWCLRAFRRLRKLRVDFDPAQSNAMLLMRFDHPRLIASRLQELEVHDMSWPSPMIMGLVSDAFPGLRVLKLSQDLIWCSLCNTCCFPTFMDHPPQRIVYEKGLGLPIHYARYLAPLVHLHTICITVSYDLGGLLSLSQGNDTLWCGECDACMDMMFYDVNFKDQWVERKKTMDRPPALKRVEWLLRHKKAEDVFEGLAEDFANDEFDDYEEEDEG
ncbi:hypothetical protein C8Q70DRAFT_916332 [Cubamyces menziesii]|nr:hypothetical protein C8Q70DRAFT_916332 [Cubamyces menziesii]